MRGINSKKIDFIQAMRGIAALCVVLYHGSFWTGKISEITKYIFYPAGYFGVSLFFVISGFIMVISTKRSDSSINYVILFLIKRFTRIWPTYFIATLLTLLLLSGIDWFLDAGRFVYFLRSVAFIPKGDALAPTFGMPALSIGWTLTYEMLFYLIFAISMLTGALRWVTFYSLIIVLLIATPFFLAGRVESAPTSDYGFSSIILGLITSPIIWLFVSGVAIGNVYSSRFAVKSRLMCWLVIMAAVAIVIFQYISRFKIGHGILEWGLSIIPLVFCFAISSKTINFRFPSPLIYLGNISFSLYLVHVLMQGATLHTLVFLGLKPLGTGVSSMVMTTSTSIVVAGLMSKYVENYLPNKLSAWANARKKSIVTG